ncbi:MAG: exodeoxyribonuclease VII large subunit [Oscillospiraceae bacterium]|jgi:exodeoxyribonuclease VII large subunit|nr:exodeoxyribonuclease VII large subunit [Oscillospiraceae bacterium]
MMETIFTVSQLNTRIAGLLEADPVLSVVCVRGELSNYKVYPSGHHYFTLKDAESTLSCVMFKGSASKLRFRPESGMSVLVSGRVQVYQRDGKYQLYASQIIPEGTGDLQVAFEQLKAKLGEEGLFDPDHKKPLPEVPERIAVVTSSAGAAVHDIIRILRRRWPMSKVLLLPVRVQGVEAPPEIVGAIRYCNAHDIADVMIVGRGGGSIEDLWAFNDERVARAIYASDIPVISAVGHEPDVTISDYVADARASTPSNAAEIAVPDQTEEREALLSAQIRLSQTMQRALDRRRTQLEDLSNRRVLTTPTAYIDNKRLELDHARTEFTAACERYVTARRSRFVEHAAKLDTLSPLKVLARGYSFVKDSGDKPVKSVADVSVGDAIRVQLTGGELACRVEDKVVYDGEKNDL